MTISSTEYKQAFVADGSTKVFTFTFVCPNASWISATVTDDLGTVYNYSYTVDALAKTVTFTVDIPSGYTVTVTRQTPVTQELDYIVLDNFPAESHEAAIDKLTMIDQEQDGDISDINEWMVDTEVDLDDLADDVNGLVVMVNANQANIASNDLDIANLYSRVVALEAGAGAPPTVGYGITPYSDEFDGALGDDEFVLTYEPIANTIAVYLDGILQPSANYSVAVQTVTLTTALLIPSKVVIYYAVVSETPVVTNYHREDTALVAGATGITANYSFVDGSLRVFLDGVLMSADDYTTEGRVITFDTPLFVPATVSLMYWEGV